MKTLPSQASDNYFKKLIEKAGTEKPSSEFTLSVMDKIMAAPLPLQDKSRSLPWKAAILLVAWGILTITLVSPVSDFLSQYIPFFEDKLMTFMHQGYETLTRWIAILAAMPVLLTISISASVLLSLFALTSVSEHTEEMG